MNPSLREEISCLSAPRTLADHFPQTPSATSATTPTGLAGPSQLTDAVTNVLRSTPRLKRARANLHLVIFASTAQLPTLGDLGRCLSTVGLTLEDIEVAQDDEPDTEVIEDLEDSQDC